MGQQSRNGQPAAMEILTAREWDCLCLVAERLNSKQIAGRLGISHHTVNDYLDSAREKLGVATRLEAANLLFAAYAPPNASGPATIGEDGGDGQAARSDSVQEFDRVDPSDRHFRPANASGADRPRPVGPGGHRGVQGAISAAQFRTNPVSDFQLGGADPAIGAPYAPIRGTAIWCGTSWRPSSAWPSIAPRKWCCRTYSCSPGS